MPGLVGGDWVWKRWSHTKSQRFGSESWFFYDLFSWLTSQFVRKNDSIVKQHQNNNIHDDDVLINKEGIAAFHVNHNDQKVMLSVRLQPCVDLTCLPPISGSQRPLLDEIQTSTFLKKHCTADLQSCFHVSLLQHTWYNDQLVIRRIKHGD